MPEYLVLYKKCKITKQGISLLSYGRCIRYCLRSEIDFKQDSFSKLKLLVTNNFENNPEMS